METNDEINNTNDHNVVKNLNWQETDQSAIYKRCRGQLKQRKSSNILTAFPVSTEMRSALSLLFLGDCIVKIF